MSGKEQWHDVGNKPTLQIECSGHLTIRGGTDASVVARGDDYTVEGTLIRGAGDLRLLVPHRCTLILTHVAGDLRLKGIQGDVTVQETAGDARLLSVSGGVTVGMVYGDLAVSQIGGAVSADFVSGDVRATHVAGLTLGHMAGDLSASHIAGALHVGQAGGDATVKQVTGSVTLAGVAGDCHVADVAGVVAIDCGDDVRLSGPLTAGKHVVTAASTITLLWPDAHPLTLTATAPTVRNRLPLTVVSESADSLHGTLGSDGPLLTLSAAERITLRSADGSGIPPWDGQIEIDLDLDQLGQQLTTQIGEKMATFSQKIGPELTGHVEQALRRAQSSIDKAIARMEQEMQRTGEPSARAPKSPPTPPPPPSPPKAGGAAARPNPATPPPPPAPVVDSSAEQLKILKLLEDGVISVQEANDLLAALG
jgi:hypothetical protein